MPKYIFATSPRAGGKSVYYRRFLGPVLGRRSWADIQQKKYGDNWKKIVREASLKA